MNRLTQNEIRRQLAMNYAHRYGHEGKMGGWIYSSHGRVICQGWMTYYSIFHHAIWESINGEAS